MKNWIILAFVAVLAAGCDAPNQSSEQGAGSESVERAPVDPAESEESDTTTVDQRSNDSVQ